MKRYGEVGRLNEQLQKLIFEALDESDMEKQREMFAVVQRIAKDSEGLRASRRFFRSQFETEDKHYEFMHGCYAGDTDDANQASYWNGLALRHGSIREMVMGNINLALENGHDHNARVY